MHMDTNVLLAVPNERWIRTDLMFCLAEWSNRTTLYAPQGLRPVAFAKNMCMQQALLGGYSHVMFVDSDTVPPSAALDVMLAADVPMVSGITHQMKLDDDGVVKPCPMVARETPRGFLPVTEGEGIELIDVCGASCLLIRSEVIQAIKPPWFETDDWGNPRHSSDFNFCRKVRGAGFLLYAHFGVVCSHLKEVIF